MPDENVPQVVVDPTMPEGIVYVGPAGTVAPDTPADGTGVWVAIGTVAEDGLRENTVVDEPAGHLVDAGQVRATVRDAMARFNIDLSRIQRAHDVAASFERLEEATQQLRDRERLREYLHADPPRFIPMSSGCTDHLHVYFRSDWRPSDHTPNFTTGYDMTTPRMYPRMYATRATAAPADVAAQRPDPAGGVDDITAAVEGLCSCPCRRPLTPDGPSAYYFEQACQRRWMRATQADNPGDVENRPDAMPGWMSDQFHSVAPRPAPAAVELRSLAAELARASTTAPAETLDDFVDRITGLPPARMRGLTDPMLAYRRNCTACDARATPVTHVHIEHTTVDIDADRAEGSSLPPTLTTGARPVSLQHCGQCGEQFDGPAYIPEIIHGGDGIRLRLSDGTFWTSYLVNEYELGLMEPLSRELAVFEAWRYMQEQLRTRSLATMPHLGLFGLDSRAWRAESVGMSVLDPGATTRIIGT